MYTLLLLLLLVLGSKSCLLLCLLLTRHSMAEYSSHLLLTLLPLPPVPL